MNKSDNSILEQIGKGYSLPVLSPIAMRVKELASNENSSANDLADLIEKDPSLAVRVLRLANSAFYGSSGQIATISHAVMKIGFSRIRSIALAISLKDTFPMGKIGPMDYEAFWRSSIYRAIIAKGLACSSGKCNPDEAFVAGLTLEIGILIIFDLFIRNKVDSMPGLYPFETLLDWERQRFGTDHREIGQQALRYWNFPEIILECQESLNDKRHDNVPPLALLCDSARRFSCLLSEKTAGWHTIFAEVETIYGIKKDVLTSLLVSAFHEVQEISESLQVKINREGDLITLLEKANYTLQMMMAAMSKWIFFVFAGSDFDGSQSMAQYPLSERLKTIASEIKKPLEIIRSFVDSLITTTSPDSVEWKYVSAVSEEVKKVELAVMLLK